MIHVLQPLLRWHVVRIELQYAQYDGLRLIEVFIIAKCAGDVPSQTTARRRVLKGLLPEFDGFPGVPGLDLEYP